MTSNEHALKAKCARRESNPGHKHGRLVWYRYTTCAWMCGQLWCYFELKDMIIMFDEFIRIDQFIRIKCRQCDRAWQEHVLIGNNWCKTIAHPHRVDWVQIRVRPDFEPSSHPYVLNLLYTHNSLRIQWRQFHCVLPKYCPLQFCEPIYSIRWAIWRTRCF